MPTPVYMTVTRQPLRKAPMALFASHIQCARRNATSMLLLIARMNDIRPGDFDALQWKDHLRVLQSADPRIDCWVFRLEGDELIRLVRERGLVLDRPARVTHWTGLRSDPVGYEVKKMLAPIFEEAAPVL